MIRTLERVESTCQRMAAVVYTVASAYNYMHGLLLTRCQQCVYMWGGGVSALHGHETKQTLVNYSADKTQNKRESGIILLGFLRHAETRVCTT